MKKFKIGDRVVLISDIHSDNTDIKVGTKGEIIRTDPPVWDYDITYSSLSGESKMVSVAANEIEVDREYYRSVALDKVLDGHQDDKPVVVGSGGENPGKFSF